MTDTTNINAIKNAIIELQHYENSMLIEKIVKIVSDKYNIPKNELHNTITEKLPDLNNINIKNTNSFKQTSEIRSSKCLGKTKYGIQCTRSKQPNSLFCGSHMNNLPYGRIDDIDNDKKLIIRKRGRPKKHNKQNTDT